MINSKKKACFSAWLALFVPDMLPYPTQTSLVFMKSHRCMPDAVRITDVWVSYWGCHLRINASRPAYWIENSAFKSHPFCGLQRCIWIVGVICILDASPRWRVEEIIIFIIISFFFSLLTGTSLTLYCNITMPCFYFKAGTQVGTKYGKYIACMTWLMKANIKSLCAMLYVDCRRRYSLVWSLSYECIFSARRIPRFLRKL